MAFIANNYRLLKCDRVTTAPSPARSRRPDRQLRGQRRGGVRLQRLPARHLQPRHDSDATERLPVPRCVADSQVASRWGNILEFQGFDLITPNEREARFSLADQDSVIRPLALELYRQANCKLLILKLGARGSITYRKPSHEVRSFFNLDSYAENVVDPVGAGDALLAYATLALITRQGEVVASLLGNIAAGIACEHDGNWQVTPDEIRKKIDALESRSQYQ